MARPLYGRWKRRKTYTYILIQHMAQHEQLHKLMGMSDNVISNWENEVVHAQCNTRISLERLVDTVTMWRVVYGYQRDFILMLIGSGITKMRYTAFSRMGSAPGSTDEDD